jgi:hypothetical protein
MDGDQKQGPVTCRSGTCTATFGMTGECGVVGRCGQLMMLNSIAQPEDARGSIFLDSMSLKRLIEDGLLLDLGMCSTWHRRVRLTPAGLALRNAGGA